MDKKMSARSSSDHLSPPSPVVAVAINGNKKSKDVAYWALEKFIPGGFSDFKLIYVRPPITYIITPSKSSPESCSYCKISMCLVTKIIEFLFICFQWGKRYLYLAISAEAVSAYRKEVDGNTNELLRPYKQMFESRKVRSQRTRFSLSFLVVFSQKCYKIGASRDPGAGITRSCSCDSGRDCWNWSHQTRYRNVSSRILREKDRYVLYDRNCCAKILQSMLSQRGN